MTIKIPGSISATRYTANFGRGSGVTLKVEDKRSHAFIEIDLSLEQFGQLVTGLGVEADIEPRFMENFGKVRESKDYVVPVADPELTWLHGASP